MVQALEGKDVKDLLLNVGSGGGAAAAPSGGAAAGGSGEAAAEEKAEEKEEGECFRTYYLCLTGQLTGCNREGGVGRRHGLRSVRLDCFLRHFLLHFALVGLLQNGSAVGSDAYSHSRGRSSCRLLCPRLHTQFMCKI